MNAVVKEFSAAVLAKKVDELGALNAAIKDLSKKAEAIKDALKASGFEEVEGRLFKAKVIPKESFLLNKEKVVAFLAKNDIFLSEEDVKLDLCKSSFSVSVSLFDK